MSVRLHLSERIAAVPDRGGQALAAQSAGRRGAPVVVTVADGEPFFSAERSAAQQEPEAIVAGLGALGVLAESSRLFLVVRADYLAAWRVFSQLTANTVIEQVRVSAHYPLESRAILADLVMQGHLGAEAAASSWTLDTQAALDVGRVVSGRPLAKRYITLAGEVRRPGCYVVPRGITVTELVEQAGGATTDGWVVLHNGWLGGELTDGEQAVCPETRGLVIAPSAHPWVQARRVPGEERLAQVASACSGCRVCTDHCGPWLDGAQLEPHRVMRALGSSYGADGQDAQPELTGALQCNGCRICSWVCPAGLDPAALVMDVADRLRADGVMLAEKPPIEPKPERSQRRVAIKALEHRLQGTSPPAAESPYRFAAQCLTFPLHTRGGGTLESLVGAGEQVRRGHLVARGRRGAADLHAPFAARVDRIDPELGLILHKE